MKISIVTACFNCEKTIERTIKSVINEGYEDIDYILIDAASTDKTMEIVNRYNYIFNTIISEKDNGVADGFNKGIKHAIGDVIVILNADDELYPGTLDYVNKNFTEDIDILYGDCIVIDEKNGTSCYQKAKSTDFLDHSLPCSHQSIYISKKCYEEFGLYSLEYKLCLDYELILKMYKGGAKFKYVNYPFCKYRQGGCTYVNPKATISEALDIASKAGLSKKKVFKYKIKYLSMAYLKRILEKTGGLYTIRKLRQMVDHSIKYEKVKK